MPRKTALLGSLVCRTSRRAWLGLLPWQTAPGICIVGWPLDGTSVELISWRHVICASVSPYNCSDQLQEICFHGFSLHFGEFCFTWHGSAFLGPLLFEAVVIRDRNFGKARKPIHSMLDICNTIVSVQIDEVAQLAIDNPFEQAVAVL